MVHGSNTGRGKRSIYHTGPEYFSKNSTGCFTGGGGGLKWLGREPDHSPRASAEGKNEWSYTSASPYTICFHECIKATFFTEVCIYCCFISLSFVIFLYVFTLSSSLFLLYFLIRFETRAETQSSISPLPAVSCVTVTRASFIRDWT
jgi:hypothetical protein